MQLAFNRSQLTIGYCRLATITNVNAANYTITANIQPEDVNTGYIPFCTMWEGWVAPPSPGQLALIFFQEGSFNVPIGALILYSPQPIGISQAGDVVSGEAALIHCTGGVPDSYIKLDNAGKVIINGKTEIDLTAPKLKITTTGDVDATVGGDLNATVTGSVTITAPTINLDGDVIISGTLSANDGNITMIDGVFSTNANIVTTADVLAQGVSLHGHVHGGVTTGSDETGAPV